MSDALFDEVLGRVQTVLFLSFGNNKDEVSPCVATF